MTAKVLGLASERQNSLTEGLIASVEAACNTIGITVRRVADATDEARVDSLIAIGYPHCYPDLLARRARAQRTLWYGEALPPPTRTTTLARLLRGLPSARALDVLIATSPDAGPLRRRLTRLRERAAVEREWARNLRELLAVKPQFDRIIVTSGDRSDSAQYARIQTDVIPFGYHEIGAGPLQAPAQPRDLPVLILGRDVSARTRRGFIVRTLSEQLAPGMVPTIVEGNVYGPERDRLLGRTRVVLDIHRVPGNSNTLRWVFATAAGAVLVSEPCSDPRPLIPGVHYVEAPIDRLSQAVRDILADEPKRRRIVEAGQDLLQGQLSMRHCLEQMLLSEP